MTDNSFLDNRKFRSALGSFASGITIVSSMDNDDPVGFTCQSFNSVSIAPPLVSFCVMNTSTSWPRIRGSSSFSINILSAGQAKVSEAFGRKTPDRWSSALWHLSPSGNPVLEDALLCLDCTLREEHVAGDHWLVIANVHSILDESVVERGPLLFYRGSYRNLSAA